MVSVVVTFLGCLILGRIVMQANTPTPMVVPNTSSSDTFQQTVLTTLSSASTSVVSISINKDIKAYIQDPSQTVSP
ncbi:MAG: hypothetical protein WCG98_10305 [bacterium]